MMKKQMKRTVYEAPVTERFQVELEGTFCASIVQGQNSNVQTTGHELNDIDASVYEYDTGKTWNDIEWK